MTDFTEELRTEHQMGGHDNLDYIFDDCPMCEPDAIRVELVNDKRRRFGLAARVYRNNKLIQSFGVIPLNIREYRAGREEAKLDLDSIRRHGARVLGGPEERKGEPELIDLRKES